MALHQHVGTSGTGKTQEALRLAAAQSLERGAAAVVWSPGVLEGVPAFRSLEEWYRADVQPGVVAQLEVEPLEFTRYVHAAHGHLAAVVIDELHELLLDGDCADLLLGRVFRRHRWRRGDLVECTYHATTTTMVRLGDGAVTTIRSAATAWDIHRITTDYELRLFKLWQHYRGMRGLDVEQLLTTSDLCHGAIRVDTQRSQVDVIRCACRPRPAV